MKVVSTKLSKDEHDAMLEMVNLLGMNTAEYVRRCIMSDLCGSWKSGDVPIEKEQQLEQMISRNETKFVGLQPRGKPAKDVQNTDSLVIING